MVFCAAPTSSAAMAGRRARSNRRQHDHGAHRGSVAEYRCLRGNLQIYPPRQRQASAPRPRRNYRARRIPAIHFEDAIPNRITRGNRIDQALLDWRPERFFRASPLHGLLQRCCRMKGCSIVMVWQSSCAETRSALRTAASIFDPGRWATIRWRYRAACGCAGRARPVAEQRMDNAAAVANGDHAGSPGTGPASRRHETQPFFQRDTGVVQINQRVAALACCRSIGVPGIALHAKFR